MDQHEETLRVTRTRARRRVIDCREVDDRSQADIGVVVEVAQSNRSQCGGGVEGEHPHVSSTVRVSPPPCISVTRRAIRPRSAISCKPTAGHSTKVIVSAAM